MSASGSVTEDNDPLMKRLTQSVTKGVKKGTKKVAKTMKIASQKEKSSSTPLVTPSNEYDEEALATESDPLVKGSPKNKRSGASLWGQLRDHTDTIVFTTPEKDEPTTTEDRNMRRSKKSQEMIKEIRSRLEFSLTQCLLAILVYLAVAVVAYSYVFETKWPIIDSIYFATVTFCTVGYGDLYPESQISRLFTSFFALTGVACLGVALGVIGSNLIDAQVEAMDHAGELSRLNVMSLFDSERNQDDETESHAARDTNQQPTEDSDVRCYQTTFVRGVLPIFILLAALYWIIGAESGWSVIDTIYFLVVTATTIGYGDLTRDTERARLFAVLLIPLSVGIMGQWLSIVASAIIDQRQEAFRKAYQQHELTTEDLEVMDVDGDGRVTRAEYLSFMLVAMEKVDQALIDELNAQFQRLDVDGTGVLEREDLIIAAKKKLKSPKRKLELAEYKRQLLLSASRSSAPSSPAAQGRM